MGRYEIILEKKPKKRIKDIPSKLRYHHSLKIQKNNKFANKFIPEIGQPYVERILDIEGKKISLLFKKYTPQEAEKVFFNTFLPKT